MTAKIGRTIKGKVGQPVKGTTLTKMVDITPSWKTTVQVVLPLLRSANRMQREVAEEQLMRCAELADRYVAMSKKQ